MVYIVLRTGKVLQYNQGGAVSVSDGAVRVSSWDEKRKVCDGLVAYIPLELVERAEFGPPCRILRARKAPKRPNY